MNVAHKTIRDKYTPDEQMIYDLILMRVLQNEKQHGYNNDIDTANILNEIIPHIEYKSRAETSKQYKEKHKPWTFETAYPIATRYNVVARKRLGEKYAEHLINFIFDQITHHEYYEAA